jgi:hypothetical protein
MLLCATPELPAGDPITALLHVALADVSTGHMTAGHIASEAQ